MSGRIANRHQFPHLVRHFSTPKECQPAIGGISWTEGDRGMNASVKVGKKAAGRLLDGVEHSEMPG